MCLICGLSVQMGPRISTDVPLQSEEQTVFWLVLYLTCLPSETVALKAVIKKL